MPSDLAGTRGSYVRLSASFVLGRAPVDFSTSLDELTLFDAPGMISPVHCVLASSRHVWLPPGTTPSAGLVLTTTDFDPMVSPQQSRLIDPYILRIQ